jgi:cytochrome c-type biogenesis protein CcmH
VLYVFARAAEGPRMPLALQRLPGAKFPLTLKLDDSMAMMPAMTLSSAASVVVGARVSKTGVANPQSGDFEVISAPLAPTGQTEPLKLVINQVVP